MIPVQRLNHAVLYVRDAGASAECYSEAFGFEIVAEMPGGAAASSGPRAPTTTTTSACSRSAPTHPGPSSGRVGLYHLAWQVRIDHRPRRRPRRTLDRRGAYVGESDHGASKSLYGKDPDGNEFEIMWTVPREDVGRRTSTTRVVAPARPRRRGRPLRRRARRDR